jgi:hypothetical protein
MSKSEANQQRSPTAFLAKKAEFDALLVELQQASDDQFSADPDAVLWGEAAWLTEAVLTMLRRPEGATVAQITN